MSLSHLITLKLQEESLEEMWVHAKQLALQEAVFELASQEALNHAQVATARAWFGVSHAFPVMIEAAMLAMATKVSFEIELNHLKNEMTLVYQDNGKEWSRVSSFAPLFVRRNVTKDLLELLEQVAKLPFGFHTNEFMPYLMTLLKLSIFIGNRWGDEAAVNVAIKSSGGLRLVVSSSDLKAVDYAAVQRWHKLEQLNPQSTDIKSALQSMRLDYWHKEEWA